MKERKGAWHSYITDSLRIYRVLSSRLKRGYWFILLMQTATAILESSTIVVMSFFFGAVSSPEASRNSEFAQNLMSHFPEHFRMRMQGDRTFITALCLLLVLFIVLKNTITGLTMSRTTIFSERLGLFISSETYLRYFNKPYFWHISPAGSEVMSKLGSRGQLTGMASAILQFFGYGICCLFMFSSLFAFEPVLTVIMASVFAVVSFFTYMGVRRNIDRAGRELADLTSRENWSASMAIRGIREIVIYGKQDAFRNNIMQCIKAEVPYKAFLSFAGMLPGWLLEVSGFVTIFGVLLYLMHTGHPMHLVISSISLLFLTAWRVLPSVSRCMGLTVHIRGLRPMALECLTLLEGFVSESGGERPQADPNFRFEQGLELNSIAFRYPTATADCLYSVSLRIEKGESIGLIGPSGSGKSTLAMLLAGLLEPATGTMTVDGKPLTREGREAYRHIIGFVPQNPLLFPGSIADNVALGKWGEEYDREKVAEACRQAAMDFIDDDPRGLDFPIGDGGQGLSGGQAQRVSIARALFSNPEILVFDEATSSLDQASESAVSHTVQKLKGSITSIIIAHRLDTVRGCDRIIWMNNGSIAAFGPASEILPRYVESQEWAEIS